MSSEENPNSLETAAEAPVKPASVESNPPDPEAGDLFAGMQRLSGVTPGEVIRGQVLKVTDAEVFVDIGLKSEGAIPRSEFLSDAGRLTVQPGDVIDVWVEDYDEAEGTFTVSYQQATRLRIWNEIERAFQEQTSMPGRVLDRTKGGLTVDIGVRAFLPGSQVDMRPLRNLDSLVGQEITCKVIKLNKSRNNVVVSRRLALEEEFNRRRSQLLEQLVEGAELMGRVKNLTDYGAFVDLGGMDGLVHITDLSWGRVGHPSEVIQAGQELRVKVLRYDREKGRVSLGLKQLEPDPWDRAPSAYRVGDRIGGRVVSLTDYGAFVELEPGVEGLIHISEMTWSKRLKHPSKILNVGDRVEVVVLDVNAAQRRISLSLKQALPDPWSNLGERFSVGAKVQGRVRNLTDFGAFVEIEDGVDGLIHISDLSWTKNVRHPSDVLKKGQKVEGVILSLDPTNRRISLGVKQLQPSVWDNFFSKTQVGDLVQGKVSRVVPFGAFVELEDGIEALCHISEMDENHAGRGPLRLQVGREFQFRVLRMNPVEKRIALSLRDVEQQPSPPEVAGNAAAPEKESTCSVEAAPVAPPPSLPTAKVARG